MIDNVQDLKARRAALIAAEPQMRARDVAAKLNISEAELVALGKEGVVTTRLRAEFPAIIGAVPTLGNVMALTRNESCVHERKGTYGKLGGGAHVGLIVGDDIDLRIFFTEWRTGFALIEETKMGPRRSLQFFDAAGVAIHKIYLTDTSDVSAFDALVANFAAPETMIEITPRKERAAPVADNSVDVTAFHAAWDALKDTHEFHGLLVKFKLQRVQALRLAGERRARGVDASSLRNILMSAGARTTPIMVFVGNPGMIQIHTGPVANLKPMGPWFNVLDEKFNLHLREDRIATAWVVWKPTDDGVVTSLELFDAEGDTIATLFGKRKPGQPEDEAWRNLVAGLLTKEAA
ncbi:MAG: ChuX/HutX family heme-like substrate-binding protein [Parvibaculum sp.]|nr:ChuX/HutX family heme-like substrate-binding protein [Parvibaculum sp.]